MGESEGVHRKAGHSTRICSLVMGAEGKEKPHQKVSHRAGDKTGGGTWKKGGRGKF